MKLACLSLALVLPSPGTPLLEAIRKGDRKSLETLIASGESPSKPNRYGVTPLGVACANGDSEMTGLLLKQGAEPSPSAGDPLLIIASKTGSTECIQLLLEHDCDPNESGAGRQTPLMWASSQGHVEVVDQLLKAGADPKRQLASGFDALFFAVRAGRNEVVARLLEEDLDINDARKPKNAHRKAIRPGTSALLLAIENGHFELALDLVKRGADPNDIRSGFTPLHAISWVRKTVRGDSAEGIPIPRGSGHVMSLELVEKLAELGADPNARASRGNGGGGNLKTKGATPFFMACWTGDLPLMKALLKAGADPTLGNADGSSPLLAACGLGVPAPGEEPSSEDDAIAAASLLLELGADINEIDKRGETVMHCAAYKSSPGLIRFLDKNGADISHWNRKNKSGWTPLLIAQGFRPGNFRPIGYTIDALSEVMKAHGVTPPPSPPAPGP
ncbi:ankyrin repeat domain-containing protein [Haloferula rosea]|uniref:Ankyrin repeat domain-containing protein n=1 Tax=Haloferula rosea TaxID=490093 RepID=A0A934VEZ0_9BACT|nr:ankyrin repeat domain-containing protein [Haloferula rosea]MBK1826025.1 ankyrin repeat domain-containing protein [Haloferula rosea]